MGTFKWSLRVASMDGHRSREVEATVDTGAAYTTLPGSLLRELGVEPMDKRRFLLADGRRIWMDIGHAWATIDGESVTSLWWCSEKTMLRRYWALTPWKGWPWQWTRWNSGWFQLI